MSGACSGGYFSRSGIEVLVAGGGQGPCAGCGEGRCRWCGRQVAQQGGLRLQTGGVRCNVALASCWTVCGAQCHQSVISGLQFMQAGQAPLSRVLQGLQDPGRGLDA